MVEPSKEFKELDAAQEAIRLWRRLHVSEKTPQYLLRELARAQECHDSVRQKVMINEARR